MENRKFVKFLIPILVLGFFIGNSDRVLAYDIETHAFLTDEIIKFHNQNFSDNKIPDELKDYLIDGARREDDPPRWMNHFYDPVYNRGLTIDPKIFSAKDIASVSLVNAVTWNSSWLSSKQWAQSGDNQNETKYSPIIATILSSWQSGKIQKYFSVSDFTFQEAIRYWVNGDKEMAMFALGHILHLIKDSSVPDHTRNDPHPNDSPYEIYTSQFTLNNPDKNLNARLDNKNVVALSDLNSYFDALAKYSNNGFYSKDTIEKESGYNLPEPDYEKITDKYLYPIKIDIEFGDYKLIRKPLPDVLLVSDKENNEIENTLNTKPVLNDYWSRLSAKSVQYGAGVINLFFQEVEKAKNDPNFVKTKEKSFFGQVIDSTKSFFIQIGGFFSDVVDNNGGNFQPVGEVVLGQPQNVNNNQSNAQTIKQCSFATSQSPSRSKIIINEVAWMGGVNSADNEWIELKNISNTEINLAGYQLIDKAEQIKIVFDNNAKISAGGFYLLERTDDNAVLNIKADKIYTGGLANSNESLRLFNGNCGLIDEVFANPGWPAGDNSNKKTMERRGDFNWQTSAIVGGTPKKENSSPIVQEIKQLIQPEEKDNEVVQVLSATSTAQQATSSLRQNQQAPQAISFKQCAFQTNQSPSRQKVLINEAAWMGGLSDFGLTANDEWFELKNISNAEVNLNGWQILDKSENIKIVFDGNAKISVNGFYLLERTDDNSAPNVSANLIYSGTLNNSDEGLRLFDNQCNLIDEALAAPNWPAGDNVSKRTMERSPDLSWHTYNGIAKNNIFGTPKKENSAPTVVYSGGGGGSNQQTTTNNQQQAASNQQAKILINEIQLLPTDSRFIELYNPNDSAVDLTNWYIQRETQIGGSFGSLVSKTYFEGKTIGAYGYFLISRDDLSGSDIILNSLTLTESNTIQIKNSDGEVVDKVGWGTVTDCEGNCALNPADGQSIQRKFQSDAFIDTDSNAQDFEIQTCPSPKTQSQVCQTSQLNQAPTQLGANHIVIGEIYPDKTGNNFDFIELYNPTDASIILKDYSLRIFKEGATSSDSLASFSISDNIAAKSFFLIGLGKYNQSTSAIADISRSSSLPTTKTATIILYNDNNSIDEFNYNPANIAAGQSLERKAFSDGVCISARNDGEFLGNSCDTDSAIDFEIRDIPNPQNSQNFPEPRANPTAPENFSIQYSSSTMSLNLSWSASQDYNNATSTIVYKIKDISNSSSTFSDAEISTTSTNFIINEIGRDYQFSVQAFDKEGLGSAVSFVQIKIPAAQNDFSQTQALISQLDDSVSSQDFLFLSESGYQRFGNGFSGKLYNMKFKILSYASCNNFKFSEYDDGDYNQQINNWQSYNSLIGDNPNFIVRLIDNSVLSFHNCFSTNGVFEQITIDFSNSPIQLNPDKYYELSFESADRSRQIFFRGSASDAGFGDFRMCSGDCVNPSFDIYFILNGLP